ncbi:MAG: MFS transporter [Erysipelotrichaceae bacterium]|jgi:GPH family glycoside/pentoside/hexuronide:cation symporter|nr:MFS transporter [Erysipelotrichaceae bacterium]
MRELKGFKMFALVLGHIGVLGLLATLSNYLLIFFAPTPDTGLPLLLPIGVIGIIQGVSFAFDGLIDTWIASISDNNKNPKGRRIPLMRLAMLPAAAFCALIFFVPLRQQSAINAVWVAVMLLLYCLSRSFYDVNVQAIIPEIIQNPNRRMKYYSLLAVVRTLFTLLISSVPAMVHSLRDGGMDALYAWRVAISLFPFVGLILMAIPTFVIKENEYINPENYTHTEKVSMIQSITSALKIRDFSIYIVGVLFYTIASGMYNASLLYVIELVLGLKQSMMLAVIIVLTFVSFGLYPLIVWLSKRFLKKNLTLVAISLCALAVLITLFSAPISNFLGSTPIGENSFWTKIAGPEATIGSIITLFIIGFVFAYPMANSNIVAASLFADFAQYDSIQTGRSRSGMFMAVQSIANMIPGSLVPALVSLLIYIGSHDQMPTVQGIRAVLIVSLVACIPSFLFYASFNEKEMRRVNVAAHQKEMVQGRD